MHIESKQEKKRKTRSPNFPAMPLERAISFVQTLYDKYKLIPVAFEVAIKALGYSLKSSAGLQTMAALSSYGLIDVEGTGKERKIKVSQETFKVIMDKRPNSPERDAAIKEAALKPAMFRKLKDAYPDHLPADDLLEYELTVKYKFNPDSVRDFIDVFKQTMDFAKIYESDIIGEKDSIEEKSPMIDVVDKVSIKDAIKTKVPFLSHTVIAEREIANFPIKGGTIRLLASGPVTQKAIDKLIRLLELSKDEFPENEQTVASKQSDEQS